MSIEKTSSFYITTESPSLLSRSTEFTTILPSEILFSEHEAWRVGLTSFVRQHNHQTNQLQQKIYKFWIKEYPCDIAKKYPNDPSRVYIIGQQTWGEKVLSISINTNVLTVTIPMENYTWPKFSETLTQLFNNACLASKVNLRMEMKQSKILFHRISKSGDQNRYTIDFSDDLKNMLTLVQQYVVLDSLMWSIIVSYGGKFPTALDPPSSTVQGAFYLPKTQEYSVTIDEKYFVPKGLKTPEITSSTHIIAGGQWTFNDFAHYLNTILSPRGVTLLMDTNRILQGIEEGSSDVKNIYIGGMHFKKRNVISSPTIKFNRALQQILNLSLNPISLFVEDEVVESHYRIPMLEFPSEENMFEVFINPNKNTEYEICNILNNTQKDTLGHIVFNFDPAQGMIFSIPSSKHEFTLYEIRFDYQLGYLLGLNHFVFKTSCMDNNLSLSNISIKKLTSVTDDKSAIGNTVYWVYTNVISDDHIIASSALQGRAYNTESDKFKLLRVLTSTENSENAIYPVHYIPLDRHRIISLNFKICLNTDDTSPIVMTLHFVRC